MKMKRILATALAVMMDAELKYYRKDYGRHDGNVSCCLRSEIRAVRQLRQ